MNYNGDNQTFNVSTSSTVTGSKDQILLSNDAISLGVSGNQNNIQGGTGADSYTITGDGNDVSAGNGPTTLTMMGANNAANLGSGTSTVTTTGNGAVITSAANGALDLTLTGDNAFISTQSSGTITATGSSGVYKLGVAPVLIGIKSTSQAGNSVFTGSATDTIALLAGDSTTAGTTIYNYDPAADKLAVLVNSPRYGVLSADGLAPQQFLAPSQFEVSNTGATQPSTRFVYNPQTGHLLFTPYGAAPISTDVATLPTGLNLQASDIFVSNQSNTGGATQSLTAGAVVPAYQPPPTPAAPAANFAFTDFTKNVSSTTAGEAYQGPVNYLQQSFIKAGVDALDVNSVNGVRTPDGINIAALVPNVYIVATGGEAVSVKSGQNVISGGVGSNFLTGTTAGNGTDTFFTDARTGGQIVWNTIVNFHQGDTATLWGFVQGQSTYAIAANEGAPGYTGATLYASLSGAANPLQNYDAKVTLAGLNTTDLQQRIPITFGNAGGNNPYLALNFTG